MLDNLSGGRLIAGMPVGLSYDANQNGGIPPIETRSALPRGPCTAREGVVGDGAVRLERQVLALPVRQHLAAPGPAAAAAVLGAWLGDAEHARGHPRPRGRLRLPELVRRDADRAADLRPLLEPGGREGPRPQPLPRRVPADGDGRGHRRGGRAALWRPRRSATSATRSARSRQPSFALPGYVEPAGIEHIIRDPGDLGLAPKLPTITFRELVDTRAVDLRRRRHRARADHRVRQGVPDRQPARDAPRRIDAARARAATTSTRSRRACCRTCGASGRTRGGSTAGGPPESASASATRSPPDGGREGTRWKLQPRCARRSSASGTAAWTCT